MPEGPECKTLVDDLNEAIAGKTIHVISITGGRYLSQPFVGFDDLSELLPLTVVSVKVKGKFIWFECSNEISLWSTLGMTGWWSENSGKYDRIVLSFSTEASDEECQNLYYSDTRNFGTFKVCQSAKELDQKLRSLGPDIMDNIGFDLFETSLRKKNNWNICKALMDQSVVSGIGNYCKAEILYRCSISPFRLVSEISRDEMLLLHSISYTVLTDSYASRGIKGGPTTGNSGGCQFVLHVYGKRTCPAGHSIRTDKTPDGRTTHWVAEIQH